MINEDDQIIDEPTAESGASKLPQTPGEMLRGQREARALSVQQVADELHLTMHFIRALESDAYDKLPGDVFARGYLRSYATLLQLDPDQMMRSFNEYVTAKDSRQQAARHKRAAKRRKDKNLPWIVFSGVAFIVVAIALWYFSTGAEIDEGSPTAAAPAPAIRMPLSSPVGTAVPRQQFPPAPTDLEPVEDDVVNDLEVPTEIEGSAEPVTRSAEPVAQSNSSSSTARRLITVESLGDDLVRIALTGESWIAVDDNSDQQIFGDLLAAGDVLELRGTAPMKVLLGDAGVAQVFLNGQQIDMTPHIRQDNSARLTLGL